jgi:hypothetical protein
MNNNVSIYKIMQIFLIPKVRRIYKNHKKYINNNNNKYYIADNKNKIMS